MDEARYKLFKQHLADWLKEDQDKIKLKDIDLVSFLLCNESYVITLRIT